MGPQQASAGQLCACSQQPDLRPRGQHEKRASYPETAALGIDHFALEVLYLAGVSPQGWEARPMRGSPCRTEQGSPGGAMGRRIGGLVQAG